MSVANRNYLQRRRVKLFTLPLVCLLLSACATSNPPRPPAANAESAEAQSQSKTSARLTEIATTPLSDLNLVRTKIPPVLLAAKKHPYALPEDRSCAGLMADVQAIDAVLGADLDVPPTPSDPGMIERGAGFAGESAMGAARGVAEGIVPFRSWVRKLTGAERHSKEVSAAIAAGAVRRAFLKGLGQAAGCKPPASPRAKEPTENNH